MEVEVVQEKMVLEARFVGKFNSRRYGTVDINILKREGALHFSVTERPFMDTGKTVEVLCGPLGLKRVRAFRAGFYFAELRTPAFGELLLVDGAKQIRRFVVHNYTTSMSWVVELFGEASAQDYSIDPRIKRAKLGLQEVSYLMSTQRGEGELAHYWGRSILDPDELCAPGPVEI